MTTDGREVGKSLRIIGLAPFTLDERGRPVRIASLFPRQRVLVTVPGIHATQRLAYVDAVNQQRRDAGQALLTDVEEGQLLAQAVDLTLDESTLQIRPDLERIELAFEADEVLSAEYTPERVRYLDVRNKQVHDAIKRRGACWRIAALPTSNAEMRQMIERSRIAIHGRPLYYYDDASGIRWLTCHEFSRLGDLPPAELRQHLDEIRDYSARTNRLGNREVRFFMADQSFLSGDLAGYDFTAMGQQELQRTQQFLREKFCHAVPPEFREDVLDHAPWRNRMFMTLIGKRDEVVAEEDLLGLGSEFFLQVKWLPGARFEQGETILDPIFESPAEALSPALRPLYEEKVPGFIFNLIREYGDLEYVNLGRVVHRLGRRKPGPGRREVYVASLQPRGLPDQQYVKVIRMQKWGAAEYLDRGYDMLSAMRASEEYTEYVLGRRVGCRQLGMNILPKLSAFKITETYRGKKLQYYGWRIWSTYFERDYVGGLATEKIPAHRFASEDFARSFARLLGAGAAPNLIVGRCVSDSDEVHVVFDDGDEVILEEQGLPRELLIVEQMGSFQDYRSPLERFAPEYAGPVLRRLEHVSRSEVFASEYLDAFVERFTRIQQEYRHSRKAFDSLFSTLPRDEAGSLRYRWELILARLRASDPRHLRDLIRQRLQAAPPLAP